jgi:hypothetical protein
MATLVKEKDYIDRIHWRFKVRAGPRAEEGDRWVSSAIPDVC